VGCVSVGSGTLGIEVAVGVTKACCTGVEVLVVSDWEAVGMADGCGGAIHETIKRLTTKAATMRCTISVSPEPLNCDYRKAEVRCSISVERPPGSTCYVTLSIAKGLQRN
jgi:hypothetical protein